MLTCKIENYTFVDEVMDMQIERVSIYGVKIRPELVHGDSFGSLIVLEQGVPSLDPKASYNKDLDLLEVTALHLPVVSKEYKVPTIVLYF